MERAHRYTNDLIHEQSPYLLQHAHNPVNWKPWKAETLERAQKENKLLVISIGYAACHWCHVMEHQSFEDEDVARLMNDHFISIKVDREERPDVDQVYMDAVQLISGRGGWPLNAFALPDGRPFYAGTYYARDQWVEILRYFIELYKKEPEKIIAQANQLTEGIRSVDHLPPQAATGDFTLDDFKNTYRQLASQLDPLRGGINRAPKFPMPSVWDFLLHYYDLTGDEQAIEHVHTTLKKMAFGGIYDHLGGGFARYSTDADWHVPHFEKMLYDNAQLVSLYAHAYQQRKDPLYKQVVEETLGFVRRELTSPEGGFFSSLDADSEGVEGKYYVWTRQEIDALLGKDARVINAVFDIHEAGNWEDGKNILRRLAEDREVADRLQLPLDKMKEQIARGRAALLSAREERIRPGLDDKILTSWNALMMRGYVHAYRAFDEKVFLDAALANARFLISHAIGKDHFITRSLKDGPSDIPGFLDDYAFTISAFIELYQATFDVQWLDRACDLALYVIEHFHDPGSGLFFYSHHDHADLIARKLEISDNVIPASNSEMARNLYNLGNYFYNENWLEMAEKMMARVREDVKRNLFYFSNWGILQAWMRHPPAEVAILGEDFVRIRTGLDHHYLPFTLLSGGRSEGSLPLLQGKMVPGKTTIYVCRDKTCKLPVQEVPDALELLREPL